MATRSSSNCIAQWCQGLFPPSISEKALGTRLTGYHQAGTSNAKASWYRLDDYKATILTQTFCNCAFFVDWLRIRRHLIAKGCLPKGFDLRSIYTKVLTGQSCSEHALFISRKTRTDRKYFAKSLKHENPEKMLMERNRPVETSQPVEEDNLFKQTGFSSNFPIGSTKSVCSIHFLSGIIGIFVSIVNNPSLMSFISIHSLYFKSSLLLIQLQNLFQFPSGKI